MSLRKDVKWDMVFMGIVYIVLGIVALIDPEATGKTLGYLIGILLIVAGAVSMIGYLLRDTRENYYRNEFRFGLVEIAMGWIILAKVELFIDLIPFLLSFLVIISGCGKLQDVIDMKRMNDRKWKPMLIGATVNVLYGVLLIMNPFPSVVVLGRVIGAGLLLSGISDGGMAFYLAKRQKEYRQELIQIEGKYEEIG